MDLATFNEQTQQEIIDTRIARTKAFVKLAGAVRQDVDTKTWLGQGDNRWVDTYSFQLPNLNTANGGDPGFGVRFFYFGVTAAGTASAAQSLYKQQGQGGNALILVCGVTMLADGATNAALIQQTLFGLSGAALQISREYAKTVEIPIEGILNCGFTAASNTAGMTPNFDPRWYQTSLKNPLFVIQPTDNWEISIINVTSTTVVAANRFIVWLVGQQLRINN